MDRPRLPLKHGNDPWSAGERASKRRKLSLGAEKNPLSLGVGASGGTVVKDDWDDSLELTQADLETLDVIASQAFTGPEDGASSSKDPVTDNSTAISFLVPDPPHSVKRQTSSSSDSSSRHPASTSSRSFSETNGSLSSHSSSNGKLDQSEPYETLRTKLEQELKHSREENYRVSGEVKYLRESLHKQEEELEKLRAVRDELTDQKKEIQTQKEQELEAKVKSLTSQAHFKAKEFQDLQMEYQKLQLKFKKHREESESLQQSQLPISEPTKLAGFSSQQGRSPSPKKVKVKASPPSKHVRSSALDSPSSSTFPTKSSFMEQASNAASPVSSAKRSMTSLLYPSSCQKCKSNESAVPEIPTHAPNVSRRLYLNVSSQMGSVDGPQIVKHLLRSSASMGGSEISHRTWDPGLSGLLHAMSTSLNIAGLTYTRLKDSSLLTPLKPKPNAIKQVEEEETLQVVSRDNFDLAIEGLCRLIDQSSKGEDMKESKAARKKLLAFLSDQVKQGSSRKTEKIPLLSPKLKETKCEESGAVLLLPLLSEYVQHYVDLLSSPVSSFIGGHSDDNSPHKNRLSPNKSLPRGVSPHTDSIQSFSVASLSSYESSLDSLSSCVIQLVQKGRVYATSLEGYAFSSLRCMALLIQLCPDVGTSIITSSDSRGHQNPAMTSTAGTSTTSSNMDESLSKKQQISTSGADADDERSTSSSEIRVRVDYMDHLTLTAHHGRRLRRDRPSLLQMLLTITSQDLEESNFSHAIVAQSLAVLTHLGRMCPVQDYYKLDSIISRGILANCFQHSKHCDVIVWSLRLFEVLASHEKLFEQLFNKSEKCALCMMHAAFFQSALAQRDCDRDMEKGFVEYISCMSSLAAQHRHALFKMLTTPCHCSRQLVPTVILVLYALYQGSLYPSDSIERQKSALPVLAQGVILIHILARTDRAFAQNHVDVQLQYIRLLSGVTAAMKEERDKWELHLSALEELYDFEPDTADLSQESESEDRMDQS